ncbi:MAG: DUF952 domain-containing protein [Sciscionella sp.]
MILHICGRADFDATGASYHAASLATEGFVHCSDPGTVHLPANRIFAGRTDLVLLQIDPRRLDVPLRWEPGLPEGPAGPWFPHIYGPIPAAAVVAVHDFPACDGTFRLPAALAER